MSAAKIFWIFFLFLLCSPLVHAARYASVVMDAQTGKVLESENAHDIRHPASLTKKMVLYLIFDAVKSGKFKLNSRFAVSQNAAMQPPSKLGLKPGEQAPLEVLIMALITRSANDAAMVVAEGLSGSQSAFAREMNRMARKLGMKNTVFRNPSGLPDPHQVTTAYDMAVLGRALYRDFPNQYHRFRTRYFRYKGMMIGNHNQLLKHDDDDGIKVDGIKTGYIRASGFNLTASAVHKGRRLIVVVIGGKNRHWRDRRVYELMEKHFHGGHVLPKEMEAIEQEALEVEDDSLSLDAVLQDVVAAEEASPQNAVWIRPKPEPAFKPPTQRKKKARKTTGVQVGEFGTRLQAAMVAGRVAKFSGGKVFVQRVKKGAKNAYLAQVKGLKFEHAKTICQDLKKQKTDCFSFSHD